MVLFNGKKAVEEKTYTPMDSIKKAGDAPIIGASPAYNKTGLVSALILNSYNTS